MGRVDRLTVLQRHGRMGPGHRCPAVMSCDCPWKKAWWWSRVRRGRECYLVSQLLHDEPIGGPMMICASNVDEVLPGYESLGCH